MTHHEIAFGSRPTRGAIILVCVMATLTVACDRHRAEESSTEQLRFDAGDRVRVEIRVDDGAVEVKGGAQAGIEVTFTTRARATDRTQARSLLRYAQTEAHQDGDVVRISARSGASRSARHGSRVSTDVAVRVPSGATELELDIRTEDGRIEISNVSGTIQAETGDGRIRVSQVDGSAHLRTADGSIIGQDIAGDLDVVSGDGRIRLDGELTRLRAVTADGSIRVACREGTNISDDWSLRSSDGSIELSLPRGANAELEASSGDSHVVNHLSDFEGVERRARIKGKIGAGGPFILITTMDGRIVLTDS